MTIQDIKDILGAKVIYGEAFLQKEVHNACGSDMMSDVKKTLKKMNVSPDIVRKVAIYLYEEDLCRGCINCINYLKIYQC